MEHICINRHSHRPPLFVQAAAAVSRRLRLTLQPRLPSHPLPPAATATAMQHHCAPVNGQPKRRLSLRNRSRTDNIGRRRQPAPVRCADTVPGPDGVLAGRGFGTEVGFRAASELCLPVSVPRSGNLSQFLLLCTALPLHYAIPVRWTFSPPKHPPSLGARHSKQSW